MIKKEKRTDCMGRLMEPGQLIAIGESYGSGIDIGVLHSFTPCGIRWVEITGTRFDAGDNKESLYIERHNPNSSNPPDPANAYYIERSNSLDRWENQNWYGMKDRILVLPETILSQDNQVAYKRVLKKFNLKKPKTRNV